ncbi:MAG: TIGR00159 family protein [bacterium]|nr:TIGR00159 family protein [bacterium]
MDFSLQALEQLLQPVSSWEDVLDVLLVTVVLYNLLLLIRGTRAVQVLIGVLVLVLLHSIAEAVGLPALENTLEKGFLILPLALIVLFQHEIRRALATFGTTSFWSFGNRQKLASTFHSIGLAVTSLAERRIGALIVLERLEGLRNYIENGIELDAVVSVDLLINLFTPDTPTHDGAVIIQGDRIAAAACFLPLTQSQRLSADLGTRHRAALGISDETDAVAVVVSEETGTISIAFGGELIRDLESKDLRNRLHQFLLSDVHPGEVPA